MLMKLFEDKRASVNSIVWLLSGVFLTNIESVYQYLKKILHQGHCQGNLQVKVKVSYGNRKALSQGIKLISN